MEQRLIDVNKIPYDCDIEYGCDKICNCDNCPHRIVTEKAIKEISPVLTIPENPTNGDIIKAMFPNMQTNEEWKSTFHCFIETDGHTAITACGMRDWWNAPYKRGDGDADSD